MNLARHIPILRDNPVFVLEAPRIWRRRTALITGLALVIGLTGMGSVIWAQLRLGFWGPGVPYWLWRILGTCMETQAAGEVWRISTSAQGEPVGWGAWVNGQRIAYWALLALLAGMSRYVVPGFIGATIGRAQAQRAAAEIAVTPLRSRTVVAGVFWAAAWPIVPLWIGVVVLGALLARLGPSGPLITPFHVLGHIDNLCVAAVAGAVAVAASVACRRPYLGAVAAVAAAFVVETSFALATSHLTRLSEAAAVVSLLSCFLHVMTAAAAFCLAARLWRSPSVPIALGALAAFLALMGALSLLPPRPFQRADIAWLTPRLNSPNRAMRENAALILARHVDADESLGAAVVPGLIECLYDDRPLTRAAGVICLGGMRRHASPALPRMRAMRDDEAEHPAVRREAEWAVPCVEAWCRAKPAPSGSPTD